MSDPTKDGNLENDPAEAPVSEAKAETKGPEADIEQLTQQVEKWKSDYLYLKAEFDTHKRNAIKERSDLLKYGSERLLVDILSVLDIFEQALQTEVSEKNIDSYVKGIEMTAAEFKKALEKSGAKELNPIGDAFDPSLHEALTSEESDSTPPGHVLRVFKKGYKLHEKVVRPAQVVVAKEKG